MDLRNLDLKVETMFDEALKLFAEKTTNILDFGCGTGDISFQYLQYQPTHKVLEIDASKVEIQFANETAKLGDYETATFLEGGAQTITQLEENSFDGIILSNVLDENPLHQLWCEGFFTSPCVQEKLPVASSLCEKMYKSFWVW